MKHSEAAPIELTVYHGTSASIEQFEDRVTFFTSDLEMAKGYALRGGPGARVIIVDLLLKNPKKFDFLAPNTKGWYEKKRRSLMNQSHDGMVIGGNVYAAFRSDQVKVRQVLLPTPLKDEIIYREWISTASDEALLDEVNDCSSQEWMKEKILKEEMTRRNLNSETTPPLSRQRSCG